MNKWVKSTVLSRFILVQWTAIMDSILRTAFNKTCSVYFGIVSSVKDIRLMVGPDVTNSILKLDLHRGLLGKLCPIKWMASDNKNTFFINFNSIL